MKCLFRKSKTPLTNSTDEDIQIKPRPKPWFYSDGIVRPEPAKFSKSLDKRDAKVLPFEDPDTDRFENQLMFIPPNYDPARVVENKTILFYNGIEGWWDIAGTHWTKWFFEKKCPVAACRFSIDHNETNTAELVFFSGQHTPISVERAPHQIYGFYRLESPIHWTPKFTGNYSNINCL